MRGVVVALGTFDGVHLGHRAVISAAVEEARARGLRCVAATFDPHPREVLRPEAAPKLLTTLEVREELLLTSGVDEVRVIPFDEDLSKKSPHEFVREVLVEALGAAVVVVGENFRFGYRASGDVGDLERYMQEAGGEARAVPIRDASRAGGISSTRIRELLTAGEVREANKLLGRPYLLRGEVVTGDRRGRSIGYPTANVLPDERALIPGRGVYAGRVYISGAAYGACTNVGVAPTFDRRENKVEAYLLGFDGDLYGRVVDVTFEVRLRPEMRFSGVEELKAQIARDVAGAEAALGDEASGGEGVRYTW